MTGWIVKPTRGAIEDGAPGCAMGLGQGVVALFVRPVLAMMDGVAYGLNAGVTLISMEKVPPVRAHGLSCCDCVVCVCVCVTRACMAVWVSAERRRDAHRHGGGPPVRDEDVCLLCVPVGACWVCYCGSLHLSHTRNARTTPIAADATATVHLPRRRRPALRHSLLSGMGWAKKNLFPPSPPLPLVPYVG